MILHINRAMKLCGLKQRELARRLGISPATLSGFETGQHNPTPEMILRIARECSVPVSFLFGEPDCRFSDEAVRIAMKFDKLDRLGQVAVSGIMRIELMRCEN